MNMTKTRKTLNISFTKDTTYLYDMLHEEAKETGLKLSTIVARAIKTYYEKTE